MAVKGSSTIAPFLSSLLRDLARDYGGNSQPIIGHRLIIEDPSDQRIREPRPVLNDWR